MIKRKMTVKILGEKDEVLLTKMHTFEITLFQDTNNQDWVLITIPERFIATVKNNGYATTFKAIYDTAYFTVPILDPTAPGAGMKFTGRNLVKQAKVEITKFEFKMPIFSESRHIQKLL